jgi:ribosomal protein S5
MFVYAQTLIQKAKKRVKAHLSKLSDYDLSDLDETAPTILAGIKKNDRDVTIVVRPAYDGTVIIYYQSERDVLDYEDYELWVDMRTRSNSCLNTPAGA